jgi:broad specificity phosphatase PhoE
MSLVPFFLILLALLGIALLGRPRRYYFIRHGETLLNAQHIRQGQDGALSPTGRSQAEQVGLYLSHFPIERLLSSAYPRALETSEIIKKYLHVPITASALLAERRNPSEIIGKPTKAPEVVKIVDQIDLAYHEDEYRYSDEENFIDLKKRAKKCIALLALQGAPHTVVVTHHVLLKMLLAYMLYGDKLHSADFVKLSFFNVSDNAGITICEFHPWHFLSKTRGWKVVSYNEQPA